MRRRLDAGELVLPSRISRDEPPQTLGPPRLTFDMLPQTGAAYDATLAVGIRRLLVAGNYTVAIYDKTPRAPLVQCDLARWFANAPAGVEAFDPRAVYDQHAGRFIVLALAKVGAVPPTESYVMLSVSQTDDPLAGWWSWVFDATQAGHTPTPDVWADYPCLGLDGNAVYVTLNMYRGTSSRTKLRIFPKSDLYAGRVARYTDFVDLMNPGCATDAVAVQPCHTYGSPGVEYMVNTLTGGTALTLWRVTGAPDAPRLACDPIAVDAYLYPPEDALQKGEPKPLGVGGSRVRSAVWRDGSVWAAYTTAWGGERPAATAVRWNEIANGNKVGQGELAHAGFWYAFPSLAVDRHRRVTMAVSRTSAREYPSLRYATWSGGGVTLDALHPGQGPHLKCRQGKDCAKPKARNGWGDYNAAVIDPSDDTTVWIYGGAGDDDKTRWATWVAALP